MSNEMNQRDNQHTETPEFDWVTLNAEMENFRGETTKERMIRKTKENPFVPLGCLATLMALGYGLWSFRTGQKKMSQYMMRTRVVAQGFTIVALIAGLGLSATKST